MLRPRTFRRRRPLRRQPGSDMRRPVPTGPSRREWSRGSVLGAGSIRSSTVVLLASPVKVECGSTMVDRGKRQGSLLHRRLFFVGQAVCEELRPWLANQARPERTGNKATQSRLRQLLPTAFTQPHTRSPETCWWQVRGGWSATRSIGYILTTPVTQRSQVPRG